MLIGKGFGDPVRDTQSVFRRILRALSSPGELADLGHHGEPPAGLPPAAAAVLLTLADVDTPVWMTEAQRLAWHRWLAFHTGAPVADSAAAAAFAIIDLASDSILPTNFNSGDDRYPDRSTTVLVLCDDLEGGAEVEISGPGIDGTRRIAPYRPADRFWRAAIENNALYPRGVDIFLLAGTRMLALPRSLTIRPLEYGACM
jgi:alpha-D-ribose 1-methylphosphonate 5-triphosphate synthase subunit PhnH